MGMAKYFEDNMEIIEERRNNYNSSYSGYNYRYGNNSSYARNTEPIARKTCYVIIGGKRIAV